MGQWGDRVSIGTVGRFGVSALALALLAGCAAVGPDYHPPETQVPSQWQGASDLSRTTTDATALAQWWRQFHDPVLDRLIDDALKANVSLATARAQLREARARYDLARGNLGPSVNASASAARSKSSGTTRNLYDAGFDASWEPDVFGGGRRSVEAAAADTQAQAEALHETRVSLVAEVARNYLELRTAERQLAVARSNLKIQADTYDIVRWRHLAGLASALDEAQAQTQLEQTRATLPTLETSIRTARNRLAILLDRAPGEVDALLKSGLDDIPAAPEQIAVGIPADTLRQRPDVRTAERRLAAETARLGVAEAQRYPSFRLSGTLGLEALTPGGLFDGGTATRSLLAGITAPIFDAGRIRSKIEIQDAVLEQARLNYRSTVLTALEDVENALVSLRNTRQRIEQLTRAVASAQTALTIARYRYQSGLVDFQSVLDSQRSFLSLEDQLTSAEGAYSLAQVQLYKALGGGWSHDGTAEPATRQSAESQSASP